jgi:hypothetical protein
MSKEKTVFPADSPSGQYLRCPHCKQGLVGRCELGQDFVQCPGFPHWKQALGDCMLDTLDGFSGLVWDI